MVLVILFWGWVSNYNTSNEIVLTWIDVVFLISVGNKVVWSNLFHIVLLEIDCNFYLLKTLTIIKPPQNSMKKI